MPDSQPRQGIRWNPEVNLGALLQMGAVICGGLFFVLTTRNDTTNTASELARVRAEMQAGITRAEASNAAGLAQVQSMNASGQARIEASLNALQVQIRDIPDLSARTTQVERRLDEMSTWRGNIETRLGRVSDTVTETRAEINAISRSSNAPLGANAPARAVR